jgi:DNA-binding NarL/FixJ family response regulator
MMLDEVLSMLDSLTKFVAETKNIKLAVVVLKKCDSYLISKLKRNNVLGIIPGMRSFDIKHTVEAYKTLAQGQMHWPSVAIKDSRIVPKNEIDLTDRQYQIFNLVAKRGLSNKKIAEMLSISEDTVKCHVGTILKRYGVRNRTQLALANETGTIKSH